MLKHVNMRTPALLIIGTSFHTLPDYLREHDYEYVILRDIRLAKHPEKKLRHRVVCDFTTEQSMFAAVDIATKKHHIDGVLVTYENYIRPAAAIAAHLGVPGMPISAAQACSDKFLMRQLFAAAPEPISPDFAVVQSLEDIEAFASSHTFPLILKPANLSKSLLVFKNDSPAELKSNYQRMMAHIDKVYAKYAPFATPKVLIEEFMVGPVHSVDAFVDHEGTPHVLEQVVDYQTGYEVGYDDNFHYSRLLPSRLTHVEIDEIRHVAEIGCRALGMKNSPAHIEIIRTKNGPRIVEVGARNGGYRDRMHLLANGIDITGNQVRLALGHQPQIIATKNDYVGVFELFPKVSGIFKSVSHTAELRSLASFVELTFHAAEGTFVGKSSDGYKMCASIILHNVDQKQFESDVAYLNQNVSVLTQP